MKFSINILFGIICPVFCFGQQTSIDTSGYIKGDLEYNLIYAADKGYKNEVLRLLNAGAKADASLGNGVTALMYAVQGNHFDVVKILVLNGADINKVPDNGNTALITAVLNDTLEIAEYLIRNGADINLADYYKVTPLMQAVANGNYYMADMLLYYGADVTKKDIHGTDALMLASLLGLNEIAGLLVTYGSDINSVDTRLRTPLHMAVQNGFIDAADTLIALGADINRADEVGYTPLCVAVENNDLEMLKFLITKGASTEIKVSGSQNALNIAREHKNDSIIAFLRLHQATRIIRPSFDKFVLGSDIHWNSRDFMWGFSFGISDKKYNFELFGDYRFRPTAIAVLEKESENVYFQYRERRGAYSLGLDKRFAVFRVSSNEYGIFAGVKETLTFGSYRGSSNKPDTRFVTVPRIGVYWIYNPLYVKFFYEYLNLNLEKMGNGRFNFALCFNINRKKNVYFPKYINWL
ncbi:MAG: ankyrin repeat domain-containing protein [Bacteroidales bacterium]|nr:ankyrin repeat domain-containing protein [Bacteroidales bacterium]